MKVRIVQGGIGTYEIQVKKGFLSPWKTVYDGMFPLRVSGSKALEIKARLLAKYS